MKYLFVFLKDGRVGFCAEGALLAHVFEDDDVTAADIAEVVKADG